MLLQICPDLLIRPAGKRADFRQHLSAGQLKIINFLQIGAGRRLLPSEAGEPEVVWLQAGKQWLDFANPAAARGIGLVQDSEA